jgi:hypothetical protein
LEISLKRKEERKKKKYMRGPYRNYPREVK